MMEKFGEKGRFYGNHDRSKRSVYALYSRKRDPAISYDRKFCLVGDVTTLTHGDHRREATGGPINIWQYQDRHEDI